MSRLEVILETVAELLEGAQRARRRNKNRQDEAQRAAFRIAELLAAGGRKNVQMTTGKLKTAPLEVSDIGLPRDKTDELFGGTYGLSRAVMRGIRGSSERKQIADHLRARRKEGVGQSALDQFTHPSAHRVSSEYW